jgi:hypothetical protein
MNRPADGARPPRLPPAQRRAQLLMRSAALRLQMAHDGQTLEAPLAVADTMRAALHWLWRHPEWPIGGMVVLAVLRPRRAWRWAARVWWAWRMWQRTGRLVLAAAMR